MKPSLLLDNSALEAIPKSELPVLSDLCYIVIPPVLLSETISDLCSKRAGRIKPTRRIGILAEKMRSAYVEINVDFRTACAQSLLGDEVPVDGRPYIVNGHPAFEVLNDWRTGQVSQKEILYARYWKRMSDDTDLEAFKGKFKGVFQFKRNIRRIEDLPVVADRYALRQDQEVQREILRFVMNLVGLPKVFRDQVWIRWGKSSLPPLRDFAPYAYLCYKTQLVSYWAIACGLVGTGRTNPIDIEYLLYLPFCKIFSSGGKLHSTLCRALLSEGQFFVEPTHIVSWTSQADKQCGRERQQAVPFPVRITSVDYEELFNSLCPHWEPENSPE